VSLRRILHGLVLTPDDQSEAATELASAARFVLVVHTRVDGEGQEAAEAGHATGDEARLNREHTHTHTDMYIEQRLMHKLRRVVQDGCVACAQWRPLPAKRLRWCLWVAQATSPGGSSVEPSRPIRASSPGSLPFPTYGYTLRSCAVYGITSKKEGERGYTQGEVTERAAGLQAGVTLREWGMRPENLSSRPRYRNVTMIITQIYKERRGGRGERAH
jgi:hypothetical protein